MTGPADGAPSEERADQDSAAELVGGFPRHATRDLVEAREDCLRSRLPLAGLLLAAGTTLCALGLPTERLLGPGPALIDALAEGAWSSSRALYLPLAQVVDALPRVGAERAGFLLSALALGAVAAQLWRLGEALEATAAARWLSCLILLAAPVVWTAGTSPGPEVLGALGALYAFSALLTPGPARGLRAGLGWCFAAGMAPLYLWCLPAAAFGLVRGRSAGRGGPLALGWALGWLLVWLVGTAAARQLAGTDPHGWLDLARALVRDLLAGGGGPQDASWLWIWLPALSVAALGTVGWFSRSPAGARAPVWVIAWFALPALGLGLGGRSDWELPWLPALGPLAFGWYRLFATRPAWTGRGATLALVSLAIASLVGGRLVLRAGDPEAAWRASLEQHASRGDLLLTTSAAHRHLAQRRYGLRSFEIHGTARLSRGYRSEALDELLRRIEPAHAAGARVLLDRPLDADERELLELVAELERHVRLDVLPAAKTR